MNRTGTTWELPTDLASDWHSLAQLIADTAARQAVPCVSGATTDRNAWTAERNAEQALAAQKCGSCPIVSQCRTYGLAHPKERGVYGALTESDRRRWALESKENR